MLRIPSLRDHLLLILELVLAVLERHGERLDRLRRAHLLVFRGLQLPFRGLQCSVCLPAGRSISTLTFLPLASVSVGLTSSHFTQTTFPLASLRETSSMWKVTSMGNSVSVCMFLELTFCLPATLSTIFTVPSTVFFTVGLRSFDSTSVRRSSGRGATSAP